MSADPKAFSLAISTCRYLLFICYASFALAQSPSSAADTGATAAAGALNRTVPQVEPPKTVPVFSPNPTTEEIFRTRVFEEPLVPIGGGPDAAENDALAAALVGYSKRQGPDDFASLTGFLEQHPLSPWRAALLTGLGLEYYNTAHYSLALDAWKEAWSLSRGATDFRGKAIADRAAGELAGLYSRLGRVRELESLLESVEGRVFLGSATEKISGAREGLWGMKNKPEISFLCGPLALYRINRAVNPKSPANADILKATSTQQGCSLSQVAELSKKAGLNYQMAYREKGGAFVVPAVLHWKVGHYAAVVRQDGDRYLLEDPTFGNDLWVTRQALEVETSGYFLIPPGPLATEWRAVESREGDSVWGKGRPPNSDGDNTGCHDAQAMVCYLSEECPMTVSSVHLMLVNLHLKDVPVGYSPPVGPPVKFGVRYNHREARQPANFTYSNFGSKWTGDWISYITDNPQSPLADVRYYSRGGGTRRFTGFNAGSQSFAFQQYDQTRLTRTSPASYEMLSRDGSKLVFSQSDGSVGTSRKVFLTRVVDPFGNAVTLNYDGNLRLVSVADAIGQVTTLTHGLTNDIYKITKVTDPFGRFASFDYDPAGRLTSITDVIGLTSRFNYETNSDFINALITPYGTNAFTRGEIGNTRWLETLYPDGSRDRVEFNQSTNLGIPYSDPVSTVPEGMLVGNVFLDGRNTYYWSRNACAQGYGDYTKAKIYHWLHAEDILVCSGILESTKEPLERRVWYNYAGQNTPSHTLVGDNNLPTLVGRVLDDGSTQLYTYAYDAFGHVTNSIDPVGRTMSYIYATNGIDLLEVRMTRAGRNELISKTNYDAQHLAVTQTDAAGQTTTNTYNARGQLFTTANPKGETTSYTYDANGYQVMVDGPLPGTNDSVTATYDALGRTRTKTDESGYTITLDYDALDRLTKVTFPDGTFSQYTFNRLDPATVTDRAGRQTVLEHDAMRQLIKRTDPLNRVTLFQWCSCGDLSSLTDPMGRTTTWNKDVQGRLTSKQYGDGSRVSYFYESAMSRVRQVIDEKQQVMQYTFNRDNSLNSIAYGNAAVPTSSVSYSYDPNYERVTGIADGTGTTRYYYNPITSPPSLGANQLGSIDGPLSDDTIVFAYDELGRRLSTAINGVASTLTYDAVGRISSETNVLGAFTNLYDGASARLTMRTFPNLQKMQLGYGNNLEDEALDRITYLVGATPISEFLYERDIAFGRITNWSQQVESQSPVVHAFGYDAEDQLLSVSLTSSNLPVASYAYAYDPAGNRLEESANAMTNVATYNALNQLNTVTALVGSRTNEWDARDRLAAVNAGDQRTEFAYDGLGRLASIRLLTNAVQATLRRFVWCGDQICEERDAAGVVTKRYSDQGMSIEIGPGAGRYFYTRDHLGSVRELTDVTGNVRARYSYDPFGRRIRLSGDIEADFGFAGMFLSSEANLFIARFRAYDPELGRWLSRDLLRTAEVKEGPNLYAYVRNNPVNMTDPLGLAGCCSDEAREYFEMASKRDKCLAADAQRKKVCHDAIEALGPIEAVNQPLIDLCYIATGQSKQECGYFGLGGLNVFVEALEKRLAHCLGQPCDPESCESKAPKPNCQSFGPFRCK